MAAPRAVVALDLDGVLWRGDDVIPGSADAVRALRAAGLGVAYLTNNSSLTVGEYVAKLERLGFAAAPEELVTSAQAAAAMLADLVPAGAPVLACAGAGVVEALTVAGYEVVARGPAAAVVVGWHRDFDFDGLDRASAAVRAGATLVATNADPTYPGPNGLLPGNGAIVAAVATAAGVEPVVAGKPALPYATLVRSRLGATGVMVGDRPSTDGLLAEELGWPFALVLSGVTSADPGPGGEAVPDPAPPFVGDDLAALVEPLVTALARA